MAFGPNNVLSLSNGARENVRDAVLAAAGRLLAFAAMIFVTACGLGALLIASETLITILKYGGAAYLVWIGIKLLRTAPIGPGHAAAGVDAGAGARANTLRQLQNRSF